MAITPQRVLIISSYAPSLVNFRGPMIQTMIALGHHVSVAAPDLDAAVFTRLRAFGAEVHETSLERTGVNPIADLAYLRVLRRLIRKAQPDLVITYTAKPNIYGAMAAWSVGTRSVAMITGLGYVFTDKRTCRQRILRHITTALYRVSTGFNSLVIFQNPDDRDDFLAAGCLRDPSKVRMMNGSGVDTGYYALAPLPRMPVFLMIARLLGNKGVREYGTAAAVVRATHPQSRFLLVGYIDEGPDGITQDELDAFCAKGLEYLGPMNDVRPALALASVFVLPSYREGTPRSVLEAMAAGRPILTSDAPGCRETCDDGVNGFLVPVKDTQTLVERMRWMINHPEDRVVMGAASRRIAVAKYDVAIVNDALLADLGLSLAAAGSTR